MVITPQAWMKEIEMELSDSEVLTLPGGFEPATPKSLAWPWATRLSGQLRKLHHTCDWHHLVGGTKSASSKFPEIQ